MSDGPHRSLNLRPGWKKVAALADNAACSPEDLSDAVVPALTRDWEFEVPAALSRSVCMALEGAQTSLFREDNAARLEALLPTTAANGLGQLFVECGVQLAASGKSGPGVAVEAAKKALAIWGTRHTRATEEHYLRESSVPRAGKVREKIEGALAGAANDGLARQLLGQDGERTSRKSVKRTGLDDGVKIR